MTDALQAIQKPFQLKRYFLLYVGIGGIIFYGLLLSFFIHAERQALHGQYIEFLGNKADALYRDIDRDFLQPYDIELSDIKSSNIRYRVELREEINEIIHSDFTLAKVKLFNDTGMYLYDSENPENEGKQYQDIETESFAQALKGTLFSKLEEDNQKHQFIEVYLPIFHKDSDKVIGILELYEDVTRFEQRIYAALKTALFIPSIIFIVFNLSLFLIVKRADDIITSNTQLLINLRSNMEKYLSSSAVRAIYNAVTYQKELFQGERKEIVIFFSDVRGFTQFSEENEPEVVVTALNALFEMQCSIIHQYGGIVDKFVGDEIMATFPSDGAEMASKSALKILHALKVNPSIIFEVGISLHKGDAVVGSIGSKDRRDYTVIGNTVNTGARICAQALEGEVIITKPIYQQLSNSLKANFLPRSIPPLKGKIEVVTAYSVVENYLD